MQADPSTGKVTATVKELALYNMLLTEAIFELLEEKGVLDAEEGLIWRIGKKEMAPSAVIRLTCPACAHSFEQIAVGLVIFSAGKEKFP